MPYYVLSYSSNREEAAGASRFRPISVRGSHPDLQIDHRAGYYAGSRAVPDGPSTATAPVAGRDATNPVLIAAKKPDYPPSAILRRLQGRVELEAVVLGDGSVGDVRVTTSLEPGLDQQAIQAAKQWRFNPATSKGIPVSMPVTVVMNFMLR
jgi:protein TonB